MARAGVLLVPAVLSALVAYSVAQLLPRPASLVPQLAWWVAMLAVASGAFALVERLARRLLPLSTLLRLSLVFPDRMPGRYRIALRAGSTRHLRRAVAAAEAGHLGDTPAEAAQTVLLLTAALNRHDRVTRGHSERVRAYTEIIGEQMGLDSSSLERLRWAALLHDIGKIQVPSAILNKPGRLDDDEMAVIRTHPEAGERLAAPLLDWLGEEGNAIGQHHERFDGTGYPRRLAGTRISLAARIVAVADTYDVITSARSYKEPIPAGEARAEIARCAGSQFDPEVVRAFMAVSTGRLWLAGGPLTWLASAPLLGKIPAVSTAVPSVGGVAASVATAGVVVSMGMSGVAVAAGEPFPLQPVVAFGESSQDAAGSGDPSPPAGSDGSAVTGAAPGERGDTDADDGPEDPARRDSSTTTSAEVPAADTDTAAGPTTGDADGRSAEAERALEEVRRRLDQLPVPGAVTPGGPPGATPGGPPDGVPAPGDDPGPPVDTPAGPPVPTEGTPPVAAPPSPPSPPAASPGGGPPGAGGGQGGGAGAGGGPGSTGGPGGPGAPGGGPPGR